MISKIIKKEIRSYFKNPLFYIGGILVAFGIWQQVSIGLEVKWFTSEEEFRSVENLQEVVSDVDIWDGYIPTAPEEVLEQALVYTKQNLIDYYEMSDSEAEAVVEDIRQTCDTKQEVIDYMESKHSYMGVKSDYYLAAVKKGSVDEVNAYMADKFEKHPYTWYFAKPFTDFTSLFFVYYSIVLLAFLFISDMKKDMYELLHTKPVRAWEYMWGKILGGLSALGSMLVVITLGFDIAVTAAGIRNGIPVNFLDMWVDVFRFVVPCLFMIVCIYAFISVVFKTPLPALPLLAVYSVYSNMGGWVNGEFGYYGNFMAIFTRFPGMIMEINIPAVTNWNSICLPIAGLLLGIAGTAIWKRRRL